ncbi:MAG: SDR family NAD(P)-dependent oxidoreductase, partial [Pirellulaceae bacterium]|nr:SDR family NAD(P)-dependent oxidoreductase [Pirellulaceae bacterium]
YLPTSLGELRLFVDRLPARIWCWGKKTDQNSRHIDCDLTLMNDEGLVLATITGMRSTAAAKRERTDQWGDRVKRQILTYDWTYGENLTEPKRLGYWLVVGSSVGIAEDVASRLEHYGAMVAGRVRFNGDYQQDGNVFCVRPTDLNDLQQVFAACGELDGVVFTHGMDLDEADDPTGERALEVLTAFTQAMLQQNWERKPRVYVVTRSATAVDSRDDAVHPRQAALNGFARVAFNELDGFQFSTIDLPARIGLDMVDALTLELLCDDAHDEVALRGSLRLVSKLVDSPVLDADRLTYQVLDDDHPVLVRPLRADSESVGTARVLSTTLPAVGPADVRVRYEATVVPANLLLDPSSDSIDQPLIEFVGRVLEVGANVSDLRAGMRVAGFAPADLSSHLVASRDALHAAEVAESVNATALLTAIGNATVAEYTVEALGITSEASALLELDSGNAALAMSIAASLARRGVRVTLLAEDLSQVDASISERFPIYTACPIGIEAAMRERNNGKRFELLAAGMSGWMKRFDFAMVAMGGVLLDMDQTSHALALPQHVERVVRCDYHILLNRPLHFQAALARVIDLVSRNQIAASPAFEVSIADIAWQKLPVADARSMIVMTYETQGKELPMVLQDDVRFDPNASYLITGGFGGFGQKTAEWLIQHGARHLILTGRTAINWDDEPKHLANLHTEPPTNGAANGSVVRADAKDERKAFVRRLEQSGAKVKAVACDTSDFQRLSELFADIAASMPPLKGVFHSGAVIQDQPIAEIDATTLATVMRSKALGAWNLHLLTKELKLDHFVLYSSVANLVGNSRQAAYSAANGFLNGLAHLRQSQGLPGTSVNWGAIADVGVVAQDEKLEQFLRYTGLRGISAMEGLEVLRQGLARQVPQFGVTMITSWADWARFETRGAKSPRFATLIASDSAGKDNSARDALIAELSQLDPADQAEVLALLMREIIAAVLKSDSESISIDRAIDQLGVDSLMATEIQSSLDSKLGVSISILELIGNSTIRSVASQALKTLMQGRVEAVTAAVT